MDRKLAVKQKIKEAIILAIQISGEEGFRGSQSNCPVVTGKLKNSGYANNIDNGIAVGYKADYTSEVEEGVQPGIRHVKSHTRAGHPVRAYTYFSKGQKANPFIENALTSAFGNLDQKFDVSLRETLSGEQVKIEK